MKRWPWLLPVLGLVLSGCNQAMENQPRYEAFEAAPPWDNNQSARPPVPGTVSREMGLGPRPGSLPEPLTLAVLERGQRQFNVYCTPCHGLTGDGQGMVVQRGFPAPPSFHSERLREAPLGHFYDVIRDGYGVMYSYAARVTPQDRWAIAAYIRALQLSRHAGMEDLTNAQREALSRQAEPPGDGGSR